MLLSGSSLYSDLDGFRRYEPNKSVEQIAIYDRDIKLEDLAKEIDA